MASGTQGSELLKYKTWKLKVSIHCNGCKKKVKRVLQGVKGVYSIDIDSKQNKVALAGDVDVETITRRLRKYGKQAEPLPVKKPISSIDSSGNANADANTGAQHKTVEQQADTEKKKGPKMSPENMAADNCDHKTGGGDVAAESEKNEAEKPGATGEKPSVSSDDGEEKGKKEIHREESRADEDGGGEMEIYSSPVYTISNAYNPPAISSGYVHSIYPPPETYSPETYYGSMEPPPESYEMFNDENPNACTVM